VQSVPRTSRFALNDIYDAGREPDRPGSGSRVKTRKVVSYEIIWMVPLAVPCGPRERIRLRAAGCHPQKPTPRTDELLFAVNCLACRGERTFAIAEMPSFYGRQITVSEVLRGMRCLGPAAGGAVGSGGDGVRSHSSKRGRMENALWGGASR
jgi:hypothetical protein